MNDYEENQYQFESYLFDLERLERENPHLRFIGRLEARVLFAEGVDVLMISSDQQIVATRLQEIEKWKHDFAVERA